jgi:hypothetical protein
MNRKLAAEKKTKVKRIVSSHKQIASFFLTRFIQRAAEVSAVT